MGLRLALCALLVAAVVVPTGGAAPADPYDGLGTWVDIWDTAVLRNPETAAARMHALGVRTLFVETSNYAQPVALRDPVALGRLLEAAHAEGLQVVAWYLPSLANVARDLSRALAAVRFESAGGQSFDSFALDIEASVVKKVPLRNSRLHTLATRLRTAVGPNYELGAIIPSPRGMELKPAYWPGFPFADLAQTFDVFLPMGYFTYRFKAAAPAASYTRANVELLRAAAPDVPVHAVGGVASHATLAQVRAFVAAARAEGAVGLSLYDYATTPSRFWPVLAG